jgi:hypothetical protein
VANRTPAELEAQVLAVRERLEADPWAQVGAEAIARELRKLDLDAPSTRTIERILARAGKVRRRRRERYEPRGVPYPAPPVKAPADLWQADIVGPRHLDGGVLFLALNAIDLAAHAAGIQIVADEGEQGLSGALAALMGRHGVPRRLQLDNGSPFVLGSSRLGEVARSCLRQGTTLVFIPQGEPWRNGVVERLGDTFDQRFFRAERFRSREHVAERALAFERFHNANHRYRAAHSRRAHRRSEATGGDPSRRAAPRLARAGHGRVHPLHVRLCGPGSMDKRVLGLPIRGPRRFAAVFRPVLIIF